MPTSFAGRALDVVDGPGVQMLFGRLLRHIVSVTANGTNQLGPRLPCAIYLLNGGESATLFGFGVLPTWCPASPKWRGFFLLHLSAVVGRSAVCQHRSVESPPRVSSSLKAPPFHQTRAGLSFFGARGTIMLPAKMLVKLASKFCLEPLRYAPGSRGLFLVRMIRRWGPLARGSAIMRMVNRGG